MGKLRSGTESSSRPGTPLKSPVSPAWGHLVTYGCVHTWGGRGEGSWAHGLSIMEKAGSLDFQVMDEHAVRSLLDVRP